MKIYIVFDDDFENPILGCYAHIIDAENMCIASHLNAAKAIEEYELHL